MTQQPDTLTESLSLALHYAANGWRVFPLLPGSKRPATPNHRAADCDRTDPWCRTGHAGWEQRATNRPDWITRAWSSNPAYGVGIACGPSRLVVVDLDTHKPGTEIPEPWHRFGITTGADVLDHLAGAHGGTITPTYTVRTVSGGTHLYYTAPDTTRRFTNTAGKIGWLIDTRAHGGYVAAPPTQIGSSSYDVTDDRPPAPLPMFLLDLLSRDQRPTPSTPNDDHNAPQRPSSRPYRPAGCGDPVHSTSAYVEAVIAAETAALNAAPDGGRNLALWVMATNVGKLINRGLITEHAALDRVLAAAAGHIAADAYDTYQAEATIRSGFHRAATKPTTSTRSAA
ncbi:bifunctional DNA primase/polymerase [Nocardioides sp. NPDC006273]|uniref:bifunctional DNA primase/polymerase n=1 Tax=Nocardioides sp. NPDC006273 TaxID=3155598 RepID=UPI0033B4A92D